MSKNWGKGSTRRWRVIRGEVLAENQVTHGGQCRLQMDGCTGVADSVHHLIGKKHGDDKRYLVAACMWCNNKVGDPTTHDPPHTPSTAWG